MKQNKGFTLIELLVVVAIIGILASVVLASLNSARGKGADAAIKGEMSSIRAQAEIYYDNNGAYATNGATMSVATCTNTPNTLFEDTVVAKLYNSIMSRNNGDVVCAADATSWAVASKLTQGTDAWCVDSTGASQKSTLTTGQTASNAISGTACNN
jgi:prepilin-type N-terminal cleavage/methylation domain-containing protein